MRISDVIRHKGSSVVTIRSDATIKDLLTLLAEHKIGAVVVSDDPDAGAVSGIVSERDVVRRLTDTDDGFMTLPVSQIMTVEVHTAGPDEDIESVARLLTDQRIRHLPIVIDGRLAGIVSIGDVVKHRIDELQAERDHLTTYIQG